MLENGFVFQMASAVNLKIFADLKKMKLFYIAALPAKQLKKWEDVACSVMKEPQRND